MDSKLKITFFKLLSELLTSHFFLFLIGEHTGQSLWEQFFQWQIICLDEEQCRTRQFLRLRQVFIWMSKFFIVLQWGRMHGLYGWIFTPEIAKSWSILWHLWACNKRPSCCWISFLFSSLCTSLDFDTWSKKNKTISCSFATCL